MGSGRAQRSSRAWIVVSLVLVAAVWLLLRGPGSPSLSSLFRERSIALRDGDLPLQMQTGDRSVLEDFLRHRGVPFAPRVPLLDEASRLSGGSVELLGNRPALATLHVVDGQWLVWQMVLVPGDGVPGSGPPMHAGPLTFKRNERGGVRMVLWREGAVLCALAWEGDSDQLVELAMREAL